MLMMLGLGVLAFVHTLYALALLGKEYESGHYTDIFWIIGFAIIYWAAFEGRYVPSHEIDAPSPKQLEDQEKPSGALISGVSVLVLFIIGFLFRDSLNARVLVYLFPVGVVFGVLLSLREWWIYKIERALRKKTIASAVAQRESEGSLLNAQRIANLGNWDWNIVTGDLRWSDQIYRIFGLEPQQFGATYEAFLRSVHPDDRDMVRAAVDRASSDGEAYSIDHRIVLPDGEERIVHEQAETDLDASGRPLRMSGTVQDVTGQRRAQEALRDSEEQFRVAFEQAGVGMALLALDGRWTRVNQRLCDMLGYSQEELLERRFHDLTHPDDLDANVRYLEQSLEGQIPAYAMEKRYFRKDGSIIWVNLTVALVRNASGNPNHFVSVVEDISKRKQAEQEVHDLNEGLERQVEERTAELRESEGRLALAIQSANFGTWSRNIPGDRVIWDERTEAIFGLEPGTFEGTMEAFMAQVHPDDRERIRTGHRRLIEEGVPYASDFRIAWPNGEVRHIATRASVVRGDRDSSLQIIGMLHDITERKRAEEALRDSEEQLRLITDNVPAVIAYVDANQRYRFINKRYEEWFGISPEEAYGRRISDVVGEAAYDTVKENLAKALSGERVAFETSLPIKNAGIRHVQATYVPHLSDDGGVRGVFVLVTDITERKRLEEELLRRERLATLGQLTATVSHELRNPLGVIRTSAFILRDGLKEETPRAIRALDRIERSVLRCDRIIDEMLDFTRISDLEPEPTALDDWLAGVIEEQPLPTGISLHRELRLPGLTVALDRDRFRRAVINVFDNACQAMRGEGDAETEPSERVLTVRTRERDGRIEVLIEDRGVGIAPDVYKRIFEPLFSTKGFGVGLGLPVVKQIMEQHGGGIEIETEEGRGTTVCLWLDRNARAKGVAA
ncbi:MAG: PAS domain S-box protein [Proteobacteria bacterium]|nr:PAS domain S-box protein [Pseudomonadota bacterium]